MKITLLILVFMTSIASAQDIEKEVNSIYKSYTKIESKLNDFNTKLVNTDGLSTEGGEATAYLKENTVKKIDVSLYGETGKDFYSLYYQDDELIFVLYTRHQYNAPFYFDKKMAKEYGADTFFDESKTEILENRYFLNNDEIIQWIGPENEIMSTTTQNIKTETSNLINLSNELKGKI